MRTRVVSLILLLLCAVAQPVWAQSGSGPKPVRQRPRVLLSLHPKHMSALAMTAAQRAAFTRARVGAVNVLAAKASHLTTTLPFVRDRVRLLKARRLAGVSVLTGVK